MPITSVTADSGERELLERAARFPELTTLAECTGDRLRALTAREGVDFATAVLYERVRRSAKHGPFIERVHALLHRPPRTAALNGFTFAVAPGAFWREFPHIDADGRLLRTVAAAFGCRTALIPVPSTGSLLSNARIVADWLRQQHGRVILASPSKGSTDVRLAMREDPEAFRDVAAWFNLCGMVHGTPLVERLLNQPWRAALVRVLFWWRGLDFQMVRDLHAGPDGILAGKLELPSHIRLYNIVGFPLSAHMRNRRSRMWRRALEPLGPNDGGVLLDDVLRLPGSFFPVWGADHYLQPQHIDVRRLIAALLCDLADELNPPHVDVPQEEPVEFTVGRS